MLADVSFNSRIIVCRLGLLKALANARQIGGYGKGRCHTLGHHLETLAAHAVLRGQSQNVLGLVGLPRQ